MPIAITPWEKDLADVARARLEVIDHELDALRARMHALTEHTRWRSTAFARFTEQASALADDLLRIDVDGEALSYDLLRSTRLAAGGGV